MLSLTRDGGCESSTAVSGSPHGAKKNWAFFCFRHLKSITAPRRRLPRLSCAKNTAAPTCSGEPCSDDDVIHVIHWLASPEGRLVLPVSVTLVELIKMDTSGQQWSYCSLNMIVVICRHSRSWKSWCLMLKHQFNPKPIRVKQHQNTYSCTQPPRWYPDVLASF